MKSTRIYKKPTRSFTKNKPGMKTVNWSLNKSKTNKRNKNETRNKNHPVSQLSTFQTFPQVSNKMLSLDLFIVSVTHFYLFPNIVESKKKKRKKSTLLFSIFFPFPIGWNGNPKWEHINKKKLTKGWAENWWSTETRAIVIGVAIDKAEEALATNIVEEER